MSANTQIYCSVACSYDLKIFAFPPIFLLFLIMFKFLNNLEYFSHICGVLSLEALSLIVILQFFIGLFKRAFNVLSKYSALLYVGIEISNFYSIMVITYNIY